MRRPWVLALIPIAALAPVGAEAGPGPSPGALTNVRSDDNCISRFGGDRCAEGRGLRGLRQLVVTSDGRNVYAAGDRVIVVLERNPRTGAISQPDGAAGCVSNRQDLRCRRAVGLPEYGTPELELAPDDQTLYVGGGEETLLVLERGLDGHLTQPSGPAGCLGPDPEAEVFPGERYEPEIPETACEVMRDAPSIGHIEFGPTSLSGYMTYGNGPMRLAAFRRTEDGGFELQRTAETCVREEYGFGDFGPCTELPGLERGSFEIGPAGESLYFATYDAVLGFDADPLTGGLTPLLGEGGCASHDGSVSVEEPDPRCIEARGVKAPQDVRVSDDGEHVYVLGGRDDALAVLERAPDGSLSQIPGRSACGSNRGRDGCREIAGMKGAGSFALAADGVSAYVASPLEGTLALIALDDEGHVSGPVSKSPPCLGGDYYSRCKEIPHLDSFIGSTAISDDGESVYIAGDSSVIGLDREPAGRPAATPRSITLKLEDRRLSDRDRIRWSVQVRSADPECVVGDEVRVRIRHGRNGFQSLRSKYLDALGRASGTGDAYQSGKAIARMERDSVCAAARSKPIPLTVTRTR